MPSRRTFVIGGVIAAVVLVAAVTVAVRAYDAAHRPHLDAAARRTVPAIEAYLPTAAAGAWAGPLAERRPGAARWYCAVTPIESRYAAGRLHVGIVAECAEYLRDGDHLVTDAGYASPLVIGLQRGGAGWTPVHVQHPGDGTRFAWSVNRMFTADGARVAMRASTNGVFPDPAPAARKAFGLPPRAPIVQG
ncbi:MAG TPA: hypothetical protein VGL93_25655 [Streptosporangiaceae bacterium]|jgi:hypothetical protein